MTHWSDCLTNPRLQRVPDWLTEIRRIVCKVVHQQVPMSVQLPHGTNGLEDALVDALSRLQQPPAAAITESPILAFDAWLLRWVKDNGRKLTLTEYGIAYTAFIAAHPGEGPHSHTMGASQP